MGSKLSDAALEFVPGEEFSGALGRGARNIAMPHNILVGNTVKTLQGDYKKNQLIVHFIGKSGFAVITDHRDPDRLFIPISLLGMSAIHLLHPAGPDLDLATRFTARSVIDQKIISHSVLPPTLVMETVNTESTALIGRGVVDHNVRPSRGWEKRNVGPGATRVRDQKLHPFCELRLARQMIRAHDRRHVHAVDTGNTPERLVRPDFMIDVPGSTRGCRQHRGDGRNRTRRRIQGRMTRRS